jgi:hypothetical protein
MGLLAAALRLAAQVDSLAPAPADSLPRRAPLKGGVVAAPPDSQPAPGPGPRLTLRYRASQIAEALERQLPYRYEEEGKARLRIPIPWREAIDLPFVKAFDAAGPRPPYDPVMAWQRSALLPGWGQIYNKSYLKLPVFYAGYAGAVWWISYNQQQYERYGLNYRCAVRTLPCSVEEALSGFDAQGLRQQRDSFRKNRDTAYLILLGWHSLQVIEAFVNAHLKDFDISEDLSFGPGLTPGPLSAPVMTLAWRF